MFMGFNIAGAIFSSTIPPALTDFWGMSLAPDGRWVSNFNIAFMTAGHVAARRSVQYRKRRVCRQR